MPDIANLIARFEKGELTGSEGTAAFPRFTKDKGYAEKVCKAWKASRTIKKATRDGPFKQGPLKHKDGGQTFHGWLVKPKEKDDKKLGVILIHTAVGPHDVFLRWKAEQLAAEGYTAFIADMLSDPTGKGWDGEWSAAQRKVLTDDRQLLRNRMKNIVAEFKKKAKFAKHPVCAIGYCFGGRAVLDLARLGKKAGVAGVVSFHGILDDGVIEAEDMSEGPRVLICHGDKDPFTGPEARGKCEEQLRKNGAKWTMMLFSHTRHGFTNPAQELNENQEKFGYDPSAEKTSWAATEALFQEVLADAAKRA